MKVKSFPLTWLAVIVIWVGCMMPADKIEIPLSFPSWDKLVHSALFLVLCLVFWVENRLAKPENKVEKLWLWGFLLPVLMGGAIELAQAYLTETRAGDWWDFAADALGVVVAWPVGRMVNKK